jgi:ATP-dependent DNA helicase RecG
VARATGKGHPLSTASPLRYVRGIGPARAEALAEKGLHTAGDLLLHLPFRYEDRRRFLSIAEMTASTGRVTVSGRILSSSMFTTSRRRMRIIRALVDDGTASIECVWFNQPFIRDHLKEGVEVILYGAPTVASGRKKTLQLTSPEWEIVTRGSGDEIHTGRIVPIHRRLPGLSPKALRRTLHGLLSSLSEDLPDPIPAALRESLDLVPRAAALRQVHFPPEDSGLGELQAQRTPAHRRMIFEEFFMLQMALALRRRKAAQEKRGFRYTINDSVRRKLRSVLSFRLTGAQKRVLQEMAADLKGSRPMSRLLQGDVGSGKTIVALMGILLAVESDLQAVLMAPTEILAEQHFRGIQKLLDGKGYRAVLLTGAVKGAARRQTLAGIAGGFWQIVVGTHALIQESVVFHRLGLAVVDEQHRFGVMQRAALHAKGTHPDILVMTATPIPRSLCLTVYGDLELSLLDEMPPGRKPVRTFRRKETARERIYQFVRREIRKGRQAYLVMPLVEESEELAERERTMEAFSAGDIELLVSTTVIEVGIDVPNATVMVIENAERFGLSQLHQLRGRVGRGPHPSYCVLVEADTLTPEAEARLAVMAETEDGFRIAEKDLEIRGPGEMTGTRQTGMPELRIANVLRDRDLLELAREEALRLVEEMDDSQARGADGPYRALVQHIQQRWGGRLGLAATG